MSAARDKRGRRTSDPSGRSGRSKSGRHTLAAVERFRRETPRPRQHCAPANALVELPVDSPANPSCVAQRPARLTSCPCIDGNSTWAVSRLKARFRLPYRRVCGHDPVKEDRQQPGQPQRGQADAQTDARDQASAADHESEHIATLRAGLRSRRSMRLDARPLGVPKSGASTHQHSSEVLPRAAVANGDPERPRSQQESATPKRGGMEPAARCKVIEHQRCQKHIGRSQGKSPLRGSPRRAQRRDACQPVNVPPPHHDQPGLHGEQQYPGRAQRTMDMDARGKHRRA